MLPVGLGPAKPVTPVSSGALGRPAAVANQPKPQDRFEPGPARADGPAPTSPDSPAQPVDGRQWMQDALADIKSRVANGEKVKVVFDLDDTIWDGRPRTMEVARRYDADHGTHLFDNLSLDQVGKDGYETAVNAGLSRADAKAFNSYWKNLVYTDELTQFDAPLPEIDDLAHQAHDAGAEVVYLTGRPEAERDTTRGELERMGLPFSDEQDLIMKPTLNQPTADYKVAEFQKMADAGDHVGWFITESRRDLGAVQDSKLPVPTVLLDAPWEHNGRPLDPSTPIYPSQVGPKDGSGGDVVLWAA